MNYVDFFNAPDGFPLEADATLGFMQTDYQEAIKGLAATAGSTFGNYILSGCQVTAGTAAPGWLMIAGEPVKFAGGIVAESVIIQETVVQKANQNAELYDRYTTKLAIFGTGPGQISWAGLDAVRVPTNSSLSIADGLIARSGQLQGNWIILNGLQVNSGGTGLTSGTAWHLGNYLFNIPALNVLPSEASPWYLTTRGQWTETPGGGALKFDPHTSVRQEAVSRRNHFPIGAIIWQVDGTINGAFFEIGGLGKYDWEGWALCNGNNGTIDLIDTIPGLTGIQRI